MILQIMEFVLVAMLSLCLFYCIRKTQKIKQKYNEIESQLRTEIARQQTLQKEFDNLQLKISHDLLTDPLTGLPSRKIFEDHLALAVSQGLRYQLTLCVMFLDIDEFKVINDALGYDRGDELLKEVATRLQECVRQVDTLSRFGGDEFVFIFSQINKAEMAAYIAQRLLDAVSQPIVIQKQEIYITAKIGIAVFPMDGSDGRTLLKNADIALHQAKLQGHNTYQFFREEMQTLSKRELILSSNLRNEAVLKNFNLYYQARVDLAKEKVICMEAMLYWDHPEFGEIKAEEISRIAEKNNTIALINEWLLRKACQDLLDWRQQGFHPQSVSMQISLKQFENSHFIKKISSILQETQLDAASLVFEITESSLLTNIDLVEKMLHILKRLGVQIAINNFGASHLQLQHLRRLPIDIFKIDCALIADITTNKESEAIVKTIIALANSLDSDVVADGVETAEQKDLLESLGCTIMQGILFSQPAAANEFNQKIFTY